MTEYFNATNQPLYFEDGSSLGGGERRELEATPAVIDFVDTGKLIEKSKPKAVVEEDKKKSAAKSTSTKESE